MGGYSVNLFDIATGPVHNDIPLFKKTSKVTIGRLLF